jgi:uncharacterized membrane protein
MVIGRWGWMGLLAVAGAGLWLLLGSGRVFGHDIGGLGMTLLVGCTWAALHALSSMPRSEFEQGVSPGEWKAWIGVAFLLAATVYFVSHAGAFRGGDLTQARAVATRLVMLLVAWTVLSQLMAARWKDRVQQDERDLEIEAKGARRGREALVVFVVVVAVMLGLSPAHKLEWATHFSIANLLVLGLMIGWLVESAAVALTYWRDRR